MRMRFWRVVIAWAGLAAGGAAPVPTPTLAPPVATVSPPPAVLAMAPPTPTAAATALVAVTATIAAVPADRATADATTTSCATALARKPLPPADGGQAHMAAIATAVAAPPAVDTGAPATTPLTHAGAPHCRLSRGWPPRREPDGDDPPGLWRRAVCR